MKTLLIRIPGDGAIRLDPVDVRKLSTKKKYEVKIEIREITAERRWGKRRTYTTGEVIL